MAYVGDRLSLVRRAFGSCFVEKDGVNVNVKCPKCGKKGSDKKKLVIQIEEGKFHCWVCGLKGSNIHYLFSKFATSFLEDAKKVFGNCKKNYSLEENRQELEEVQDLSQDLSGFVFLGDIDSSCDPDLRDVLRYARKRGIDTQKMWKYRLGACAEGQMRRRLLIPSFDDEGDINYYSARDIDGLTRMKYLNSPVSKKEVIFNEMMIDWTKPVTLVEGPLDAIFAGENAICLLGSHLSKNSKLFKMLIKHMPRVNLALDADVKDKSVEIGRMLASYGIEVFEVEMPTEKDVADLGQKEFEALCQKAKPYTEENRLLHLISNIRSGSVI